MNHARIDITQGLDGEAVVLALFDLGEEEIAASAHAVRAIRGERFRTADLSVDDVLEMRELTALADEFGEHVLQTGIRTIVMRPSRLNAWRDALTHFVESPRRRRVDPRGGPHGPPGRAQPAVAARGSVRRGDARRAQPARPTHRMN